MTALDFDDIIDVRAPAEWAEDHVPEALAILAAARPILPHTAPTCARQSRA